MSEIEENDFREELEKFEKEAIPQILKIIEKENYLLPVTVLGLASILRSLIRNFGNEYLLNTVINYLKLNEEELEVIDKEINKEE